MNCINATKMKISSNKKDGIYYITMNSKNDLFGNYPFTLKILYKLKLPCEKISKER